MAHLGPNPGFGTPNLGFGDPISTPFGRFQAASSWIGLSEGVQDGPFRAIWGYSEVQPDVRSKGVYSESPLANPKGDELYRVRSEYAICLRIWSEWTDPITRTEIEDSMILGPYR